jgi:hypothetical protein
MARRIPASNIQQRKSISTPKSIICIDTSFFENGACLPATEDHVNYEKSGRRAVEEDDRRQQGH